jgi:hypothetical protein
MEEDELDKACNMHGRNVYKILVAKPEGKRQLGRLMCR